MPRPEDCLYSKDHEWIYREEDVVRIGITDFAQQELGDIVFVDLGDTGRTVGAAEELGTIESVKAVAEVYAPVSGEVVEVNEALADNPEQVNEAPLEDGWLARIKLGDPAELDALMDHAAYTSFLEEEGH